MTTSYYQQAITTMNDEIDTLTQRLHDLQHAAKAMRKLLGETATTTRRRNKPAVYEESPELAEMTMADRLIAAMRTEPEREWSNGELLPLAKTRTIDTTRKTLARMAKDGVVVVAGPGTWKLASSQLADN
jgi:hypothetical protein